MDVWVRWLGLFSCCASYQRACDSAYYYYEYWYEYYHRYDYGYAYGHDYDHRYDCGYAYDYGYEYHHGLGLRVSVTMSVSNDHVKEASRRASTPGNTVYFFLFFSI